MKRYLVAPLAVVALAIGVHAFAHHSFAATYLENQLVTIEGELVQFVLRNPHSFVEVNVKLPDGTMARYIVEWGSPAQLKGKISRETLKTATTSSSQATPAATRKTAGSACSPSAVRKTAGAGDCCLTRSSRSRAEPLRSALRTHTPRVAGEQRTVI